MIKTLKKMFEANPEKLTIVLKDKCVDCGCEVLIYITSTSGGYGLQGGALIECSNDQYCAKCPGCYKVSSKIDDHYKPKYNVSLLDKILTKTDLAQYLNKNGLECIIFPVWNKPHRWTGDNRSS